MSVLREAIDRMDGRQISKEVWPHHYMTAGSRIRYKQCPECGKHEGWPFSVDSRGYKCFRCGAHGGVLKLLEVCTGMSARDAKDWVIDKAGLRGVEFGDAAKVVVRQQASEMRRAVEERDHARDIVSHRRKCLAFDVRQLRRRIEFVKCDAGRLDRGPTVRELARKMSGLERLDETLEVAMRKLEQLTPAECLVKFRARSST